MTKLLFIFNRITLWLVYEGGLYIGGGLLCSDARLLLRRKIELWPDSVCYNISKFDLNTMHRIDLKKEKQRKKSIVYFVSTHLSWHMIYRWENI